jgi:hypothetical protein
MVELRSLNNIKDPPILSKPRAKGYEMSREE